MDDQEKVQYMTGVISQLVRKIQDLQEETAAPAVYGKDVPAKHIARQLDGLLEVQDPGGRPGTLTVNEESGELSIFLGARITGERIISTEPGGFNGVVWNEEMDRAPREDGA